MERQKTPDDSELGWEGRVKMMMSAPKGSRSHTPKSWCGLPLLPSDEDQTANVNL